MQSDAERRLVMRAQAAYYAESAEKRLELMAQSVFGTLPLVAPDSSAPAASAASSQAAPSPPVPDVFPDFNYDDADVPPPPPPTPPLEFSPDEWVLPPALSQSDAQAYQAANPKRMKEVVHDLETMLNTGHAQKVAAAKHALEGKDGREAVQSRQDEQHEAFAKDLSFCNAPLSPEQLEAVKKSRPTTRPREWLGNKVPVPGLSKVRMDVTVGGWKAECDFYMRDPRSQLGDLVETHELLAQRGGFGPAHVSAACGCPEDMYEAQSYLHRVVCNFRVRYQLAEDVIVVPVRFASDKTVLTQTTIYPLRVQLLLPGVQPDKLFALCALLPLATDLLVFDANFPAFKRPAVTALPAATVDDMLKTLQRKAIELYVQKFEETGAQPMSLNIGSTVRQVCFCFGLYTCDAEERYTLLDLVKRWSTNELNFVQYYVTHDMERRTIARDVELRDLSVDVGVHWDARAGNPLVNGLTSLNIYRQFPADLLHVVAGVVRKTEMLLSVFIVSPSNQLSVFNRMRVYGNKVLGIPKKERNTSISDLILSLPSAVPAVALACAIDDVVDMTKCKVLKYVAFVTELLVCYTDPAPRALSSHTDVLSARLKTLVDELENLVVLKPGGKSIITTKLVDYLYSLRDAIADFGRVKNFSTTDFESSHRDVKEDYRHHSSGRSDSNGSLLQLEYYQQVFRFVRFARGPRTIGDPGLELECAMVNLALPLADQDVCEMLATAARQVLFACFDDKCDVAVGAVRRALDTLVVERVGYEVRLALVSKATSCKVLEDNVVCPSLLKPSSHVLCYGVESPEVNEACDDPLCAVHLGFQLGASWKDRDTNFFALPIAFLSSATGVHAFCLELAEIVLEKGTPGILYDSYHHIGAFVQGRKRSTGSNQLLAPRFGLVPQSQFRGSRHFTSYSTGCDAYFSKFSTRALVAGV